MNYRTIVSSIGRDFNVLFESQEYSHELLFERYPAEEAQFETWLLDAFSPIAEQHGLSRAQLDLLYKRCFVSVLAKGPWRGMLDSGQLEQGDAFVSTLIPLNYFYALGNPFAQHFKKYGSTGRPSGSLKLPLEHATPPLVNAFETRYEVDGQELFSGFRTAILTHYGEPDEDKRYTANRAVAEEALTAAIAHRLNQLSASEATQILAGEQPLAIHLTSIDLQTDGAGDAKFALEHQTISEAQSALKNAAAQKQWQIGDKTITVELQLSLFNIPTHHEAFSRDVGWEQAEKLEDEILSLCTEVSFVASALAQEVRDIVVSGSYRSPQHVYGLPARVALMAYLTGAVVFFNCRSGKDRTGMVDAEIKLLAHQLFVQSRRSTSGYGQALLPWERQVFDALVIDSTNGEVQRLNTGVSGSKLKPITDSFADDPLVLRVGLQNWKNFKGQGSLAAT